MSYAPALVGFVFRKGCAVPNLQGVVVSRDCEEILRAACIEDALARSKRREHLLHHY
jgi:hypothetical protein